MDIESRIYNDVSLLLAEKRTSLALLRTAIAIFTLPLSVFTILIATSRYYDIPSALPFIIPLMSFCSALIVLGVYLIIRSMRRIRNIDFKIQEFKQQDTKNCLNVID